jgi:hypothetical protein
MSQLIFFVEYGEYYIGENGSHGPLDTEFMMGRNIYINDGGDMGESLEQYLWDDPVR